MARGGLSSSRMAASTASNESLGASRVWTPLRENYFEPPLLSSRERAYLVRKSCEAAQELVERARSAGGPIAWRHVEKNNGVQIYAGSPRASATGAALTAASMCGVTSVPGTVKEVASLFQLGSTRQMKEFARAHREWFYDGVVLHTLAPRTKEKPLHQVTAKWMVVQMPRGLPHRDFCYLECQDKFIDARGRKGWVLGQHSIKLPGCDELKREFGLVRGSLYHSGFVVVESEDKPGHVDVIHLVQINLKEHTPVPASLLRARVLFVAQVRNMLRSKRLNEQRYLSDLELVPRKYRARCAVCQDSFSLLLLRKLNCRKCGEVVCAACSKEFPIENRNFAATNGGDEVRKLRICMHCFQVITNAPKPTSALAEAPHSSTMSMSFLGYHDDERRASYMTSRVGGRHGHREEDAPKIFLQSMRREKSSRRRMSSTSPIPGFGADMPPSTSRHRTRGEPDADLYQRSQRYQQQQQDYSRSRDRRESQRMRPSDFRPSQSLSLDDPIARGEGRYTLQMPGPPAAASPASIFDRPANGSSRRPQSGLPRSNSSDMLLGTGGHNMSNFSRLQELSSRERLAQLQRENNYMTRSSIDHRMPDAYMSALQQASRDKHDFDAPPPMYQPPSDFGAFGATLNDHTAAPDFGPFDSTMDYPDTAPPLDMSALTTSASTIPIELNSMSTAAMPTAAPMNGGREHELLRQRELEIEQRRVSSTSSGSSASSVDIDTYDEPTKVTMVPPIAERQLQDERSIERVAPKMPPPSGTPAQDPIPSIENSMKAAYIHDTDEDSDTSMGASDDEEERRISAKKPLSFAQPRTTSRRPIDDNDEETKAQEFAETPALPPPSPSAHTATRTVLERPSIANSLAGLQLGDASHPESDNTRFVEVVAPKRTEAVEEDVVDHEHQLQHSKVEDLIDHDYQDNSAVKDRASEKSLGCDDDVNVDIVARKYTQTSRDVHATNLSQREDSISESDDEAILNTVGCDMNYLDEDMRQFHDQSLFIRQSRDGGAPSLHGESKLSSQLRDGMSSVNSEVPSTSNVLPPYEHMPTSPKGESGKTVDFSKPSRPTISREGTFALDNMMSEEHQKSANGRAGPVGGIVLDAQMAPSNVSSPSVVSTVRTDDRFATEFSTVSVPIGGAAEDLSFDVAQRDSEVPRASMTDLVEEDRTVESPPPVIPVSMPADTTTVENLQSSGDDVSESRSRSSSKISFSSVPSSSARDSSICSMGLDAPTPPATPPSASPVAIGRLSATSASSPAAVPALDLATPSAAPTEVIIPARSSSNAPAYLPDRFRTAEQLQEMQQQMPVNEKPSDSTLSSTPRQVLNTPRQSGASSSALDNFQLDFSASFNAHQQKKSQNETIDGTIEGQSRASITEDRNRASSTGSNDVQVRYQPAGSSVLDTVPDTGVLSSDEDDSEDENMLLSARQLYGRFGNTKQLSKLGGDRPGFQHTLSQIQQSFDELSSDSEDENTPATSDAIHRW